MKLIFLTLVEIESIEERGIYQDLLRKFRDEGHEVTIVTPVQRRRGIRTNLQQKEGIAILQVKTLNIQKANIIEKGLGTLAIEYQYLRAIRKYLTGDKFDLVLYSTPPITLVKAIQYLKKRHGASSYLLLKDIFPQNAVDMKMIKKEGLLHRQFLKKEKELYRISDTIGCMSLANVEFVLKHHPELDPSKVEVNPNSIEPCYPSYTDRTKKQIREKYGLPADRRVFVYGGNLGKPQGLDFLLQTISATKETNAFFLVVGSGTEYARITRWFAENAITNAKLLNALPKTDYDALLASCDVGLIFLDKNFVIPNFPSRLLSYLEMGMPVIAATDPNTDIGTIIEENNCGFRVLAGDLSGMLTAVQKLNTVELSGYTQTCRELLETAYHIDISYALIDQSVQRNSSLNT
ncbi:MAG TPA: glycosyltransferase WbuB [Chryseobacterium sp.]|nr:glycosyltransferase WbuB [Chryseobacterium sp.]